MSGTNKMEIRPRETVILASSFSELVDWYCNVLGFTVTQLHEEEYHYCNLETPTGIQIGIADAKEMGVVPQDRSQNTVLLQIQVANVQELFTHLQQAGCKTTFGPSFDQQGQFWFGGFSDLEGNPIWVVDENCP